MSSGPRPRIRAYGLAPGDLPPGPDNAITDVPDLVVGHETLRGADPHVRTGVTVLDVAGRDLYRDPLTGAVDVLNGYGKSVGFAQVRELGEVETPVALTNTLDVWTVADAVAGRVLGAHDDAKSVNPVVGECNDGRLNDVRGRHVGAADVAAAFDAADGDPPAEGCVGAGTSMLGFGWKAGIGTASRRVDEATVGALVLLNTGRPGALRVDGLHVDRYVADDGGPTSEGGSIVMLVGTDATLSARQLRRCASRAPLGLARTGATAPHGSGDVAVGFATGDGPTRREPDLTDLFQGVVEATEEAVYNALVRAETTTGPDGESVPALPRAAIERAIAARDSGDGGSSDRQ